MTIVINTSRMLLGYRQMTCFSPLVSGSKRTFYNWLIEVFNRKDPERVKEIGADRAAAEWIIRNGGKVKFDSSMTTHSIFASIPSSGSKLTEIHANGVPISNSGLQHLVGLKSLRYLDLNSCTYISDLSHLEQVADTLEYLDIGNCSGLSDVTPVVQLMKLRTLIMTGTLGGDKRTDVLQTLRKRLPECDVLD